MNKETLVKQIRNFFNYASECSSVVMSKIPKEKGQEIIIKKAEEFILEIEKEVLKEENAQNKVAKTKK